MRPGLIRLLTKIMLPIFLPLQKVEGTSSLSYSEAKGAEDALVLRYLEDARYRTERAPSSWSQLKTHQPSSGITSKDFPSTRSDESQSSSQTPLRTVASSKISLPNTDILRELKGGHLSLALIPFKKGELKLWCERVQARYPFSLPSITVFWPIHYHSKNRSYYTENQPQSNEWEKCRELFKSVRTLIWIPHIEELQTLMSEQALWRMYSNTALGEKYFELAYSPLFFLLQNQYLPQLSQLHVAVAAGMDRALLMHLNEDFLTRLSAWQKKLTGFVKEHRSQTKLWWRWAGNGDFSHVQDVKFSCAKFQEYLDTIDHIAPSLHLSHGHFPTNSPPPTWPEFKAHYLKNAQGWWQKNCPTSSFNFSRWQKKTVTLSELSLTPDPQSYRVFFKSYRHFIPEPWPLTLWNMGPWDHLKLIED